MMQSQGSTQNFFAIMGLEDWHVQDWANGEVSAENRKGEISTAHSDGHAQATRILVVDDEKLIADTLASILNLSGFHAQAVYNGDDALASLAWYCPEIVLSDVRMPGRNGIETAILIQQQCPNIRVVLFSGQAGVSDLMEQARRDGHSFQLWSKPIHPRELVERLRAL